MWLDIGRSEGNSGSRAEVMEREGEEGEKRKEDLGVKEWIQSELMEDWFDRGEKMRVVGKEVKATGER